MPIGWPLAPQWVSKASAAVTTGRTIAMTVRPSQAQLANQRRAPAVATKPVSTAEK